MKRTRVLVVEDSITVRKRLCEVLAGDAEIDVVGDAPDGKQAVEMCRALRPDVITMDMMLPLMTGLAATEYIMAHFPTPILIVSASTNRGELFRTYDALAAGAVDVLEKPKEVDMQGGWEQLLVASVKRTARIRVITHLRGRMNSSGGFGDYRIGAAKPQSRSRLVAIGASTGGPSAILDVLMTLPSPLPAPVLVVLHINEPFGTSFADWLDAQTAHRASFAQDGESLNDVAGRVVIAPPEQHLRVRDGHLVLTREPERHSCRPSIDCLFESLAAGSLASHSIACLLTGMGRDGAAGLLALRRAGGVTIAQDEETSVVYGMPREAVLLGAAQRVLPLGEIGPALASAISIH
jgi:two-component system chemotaxis response regulator CheB